MTSDAQRRAVAKYDKSHSKVFAIKLNVETDKELIARLESQDNKQRYIKDLIRADLLSS